MNEKKISPIAALIPFLLIIGIVFLAIKSLFFGKKNAGEKPEIAPTDAGTENHNNPTVIPVVSTPFSAPLVPEIPFSVVLPDVIPFTNDTVQFPLLRKRKRITRENMAAIFRHGSRKLNLTTAVAELKGLGFGKSAAYQALSVNGQFSAWLRFAPDGIITWTDR
jgi:hypothetical protein